ncbi:MAG: Oxidoreductase, aldo/keto reductase family, partial [uncultured Gemmatimonadaceae bacterium]
AAAHARQDGAPGVGARARVHGDERLLLGARRRGVDRDDPPRPRPRGHLPRHRGHVRPVHERAARRARGARPARLGGARHQVRQRAVGGRGLLGDRGVARVRAPGVRRLARAARREPHRPLLPAPRRRRRAHRGDGRGDGRAGAGRQGAPPGDERGRGRHAPPGGRRAPDRGAADGVLALEPRGGGRDPARLPRARDRLRPLQPARARLPHRADQARGRPGRRRLPPQLAALPGRELPAEPRPRGSHRAAGAAEGVHPVAARPGLAARPGGRRRPDPGDQARALSRGERRGAGRPPHPRRPPPHRRDRPAGRRRRDALPGGGDAHGKPL